jgi:LacI family transcriptional regulator
MAAGMKDVASLAGVAVGTVSNVLNHPDLVRPLTRARVEAAMEELGFIPNGSARQLRVGRSRCLGLVVLDVTNPFFTEVARGVEDYAGARHPHHPRARPGARVAAHPRPRHSGGAA